MVRTEGSAGIEPFGATFHSDHRGLYVDLRLDLLLGGRPSELGAMPTRGVSGTDPAKTLPFQKEVTKYIQDHRVIPRYMALLEYMEGEQADKHLSTEDLELLNSMMDKLDRDIT